MIKKGNIITKPCPYTSSSILEKMGQSRSKVEVQGEVAPGYETVKEMFQQNFE